MRCPVPSALTFLDMPEQCRTPSSSPPRARRSASSSVRLAPLSAPELGAVAIRAALERAGVPVDEIDEVIMGNVIQGGVGQAPARQALLKAGVPATCRRVTVNKVCGSGLKAVMLAAQAIKAGDARSHRRRRPGVDVQRAVLRVRHAQRREARRPDDGRRHDQGRPLVRVCDVHMGGHAEYTAKKAQRHARSSRTSSRPRRTGRRSHAHRGGKVQGRDRARHDHREEGPTRRRHRRRPARGHDAPSRSASCAPRSAQGRRRRSPSPRASASSQRRRRGDSS